MRKATRHPNRYMLAHVGCDTLYLRTTRLTTTCHQLYLHRLVLTPNQKMKNLGTRLGDSFYRVSHRLLENDSILCARVTSRVEPLR
jgi:hypothetical protein